MLPRSRQGEGFLVKQRVLAENARMRVEDLNPLAGRLVGLGIKPSTR